MRSRPIGGTGLRVSELGYGAAPLGNLYAAVTDDQAEAAVHAAWDAGIRLFDTAPHYGLGLSERRLGAALRSYPREEYVVSTKVGRLLEPNPSPTGADADLFVVTDDLTRRWDFTRDGILRSIDDSLERLGLDRIDILYLHDPDLSGDPDAARRGADVLIDARSRGLARAVGIGSNDASTIADLFRTADIDLAMVAGRISLLGRRGLDDVVEAAGGRALVVAGAFNSGILASRRPREDDTYDYARAPADVLERANRIADIVERHGSALPDAAIAFPLREPGVASVVLGMRSADEVVENVQRYDRAPSEDTWADLRSEGLLP